MGRGTHSAISNHIASVIAQGESHYLLGCVLHIIRALDGGFCADKSRRFWVEAAEIVRKTDKLSNYPTVQ